MFFNLGLVSRCFLPSLDRCFVLAFSSLESLWKREKKHDDEEAAAAAASRAVGACCWPAAAVVFGVRAAEEDIERENAMPLSVRRHTTAQWRLSIQLDKFVHFKLC